MFERVLNVLKEGYEEWLKLERDKLSVKKELAYARLRFKQGMNPELSTIKADAEKSAEALKEAVETEEDVEKPVPEEKDERLVAYENATKPEQIILRQAILEELKTLRKGNFISDWNARWGYKRCLAELDKGNAERDDIHELKSQVVENEEKLQELEEKEKEVKKEEKIEKIALDVPEKISKTEIVPIIRQYFVKKAEQIGGDDAEAAKKGAQTVCKNILSNEFGVKQMDGLPDTKYPAFVSHLLKDLRMSFKSLMDKGE